MAKKEKVTIKRSDDFESVDEDLAEAMKALDESNARISDLLEGSLVEVKEEPDLFQAAELEAQEEATDKEKQGEELASTEQAKPAQEE